MRKRHEKRVLLLDTRGAGALVCDEYYPTDGGRVHLLGVSRYATFHLGDLVFESQKATFDVRIVYEGADWPGDLAGTKDPYAILRHYGLAAEGLAKV